MSRKSDESADETALTRTSEAGLQRLSANLEAVERALARSQERYVRFFRNHEKLLITLVSRWYPIKPEMLQRYYHRWDWKALSANENIRWSSELIGRFPDGWDWEILCENEALPWSAELIDRFSDRWNWNRLSESSAPVWDSALIERFSEQWNWRRLTSNKSLPWNTELYIYFSDRWISGNFNSRSGIEKNEEINWDYKTIKNYKPGGGSWEWGKWGFSENEEITWSEKLIINNSSNLCWSTLSKNEGLPWSAPFIEKFSGKWDWSRLSKNREIPWSEEILKRYRDRWDWDVLSKNPELPWSEDLIEAYLSRWNWDSLSTNEALPWSIELIDRYLDRWDWGNEASGILQSRGLSGNIGLPWSKRLVRCYEDRWNWVWLSRNENIPWSIPLIRQYEDRWCWHGLSGNEALPWSESLIDSYNSKWNWTVPSDEFPPHGISRNRAIDWNIENIRRYSSHLDWKRLSCKKIYDNIFSGEISNTLIRQVLSGGKSSSQSDHQPSKAKIWHKRGNEHASQGDLFDAVESYDRAVELDPSLDEAWTDRGYVLAKRGNLRGAVKSYEHAVEANPSNVEAWYNRGLALHNLAHHDKRNLPDALESYERVIEIDHSQAGAWHHRGIILEQLNRKEEALESVDRACLLDSSYCGSYPWSVDDAQPVDGFTPGTQKQMREAIRYIAYEAFEELVQRQVEGEFENTVEITPQAWKNHTFDKIRENGTYYKNANGNFNQFVAQEYLKVGQNWNHFWGLIQSDFQRLGITQEEGCYYVKRNINYEKYGISIPNDIRIMQKSSPYIRTVMAHISNVNFKRGEDGEVIINEYGEPELEERRNYINHLTCLPLWKAWHTTGQILVDESPQTFEHFMNVLEEIGQRSPVVHQVAQELQGVPTIIEQDFVRTFGEHYSPEVWENALDAVELSEKHRPARRRPALYLDRRVKCSSH